MPQLLILLCIFAATAVTIGLEQTVYTVHEGAEYQVVCAEVLSGNTAGRDIEISYLITCTSMQGMERTG